MKGKGEERVSCWSRDNAKDPLESNARSFRRYVFARHRVWGLLGSGVGSDTAKVSKPSYEYTMSSESFSDVIIFQIMQGSNMPNASVRISL